MKTTRTLYGHPWPVLRKVTFEKAVFIGRYYPNTQGSPRTHISMSGYAFIHPDDPERTLVVSTRPHTFNPKEWGVSDMATGLMLPVTDMIMTRNQAVEYLYWLFHINAGYAAIIKEYLNELVAKRAKQLLRIHH